MLLQGFYTEGMETSKLPVDFAKHCLRVVGKYTHCSGLELQKWAGGPLDDSVIVQGLELKEPVGEAIEC